MIKKRYLVLKSVKSFLSLILLFVTVMNIFCFEASASYNPKDISGHWAEEYAKRLINLDIMNGYEDGTFKLDGTITRAEFVKLLVTFRYGNYQEYSEEIYSDVESDDWYYPYVCTAFYENILEEEEGDEFRPGELITREEMVVIIANSLNLSGGSVSFSDVSSKNEHYRQICGAVSSGIITGYEDNTFRPERTATRGETAAMVCRILNYITDKELTGKPNPEVVPKEDDNNPSLPSEPDNTGGNDPGVDSGISGRINMTWHQIYNTGVNKTGNHMDGLNVISPTWFKLVDNTGLTPYSYEHAFYPEDNFYIADFGNTEYIADCKAEGYKVWAMFNSEGVCKKTSRFLNNEAARKACVNAMKEYIIKYSLDGINLDFENMYQADRDMYTTFVSEMAQMCHSVGAVLSVDVTKYEATSSTYSLCYDRAGIAKYADYVALMAYDQNGTWSKTAGSVADLVWTENAIISTLKEVPAQKLILAIPFYARIWETVNGTVVKTSAVGMATVAKTIEQNNASIIYDEKTGQNYAEWTVGESVFKVWIEDRTSINARIKLADYYGLAGISSWSKGFATSDTWGYIEGLLK